MPLDPHIQIFLNQYNEMPRPSLEDVTPAAEGNGKCL